MPTQTVTASAGATTELYVSKKRDRAPSLRKVWILPASLAYGRGHKIATWLYIALGLTADADQITFVTVDNVTYAVEAGLGLQPPVGG